MRRKPKTKQKNKHSTTVTLRIYRVTSLQRYLPRLDTHSRTLAQNSQRSISKAGSISRTKRKKEGG